MTCSLLLDMSKINTSVTKRSFILFFEAFFSSEAAAKLAKLRWRIMVLSLTCPPSIQAIYGIKHVWISKLRLLHHFVLFGFVLFLWADNSFNSYHFFSGRPANYQTVNGVGCMWHEVRYRQGHGSKPPRKVSDHKPNSNEWDSEFFTLTR